MSDATINSNVGININPAGMAKAAQDVEGKIRGIIKAIGDAGTEAQTQLRQLAVGLKQLETLRSANARLVGGDFSSAQNLGRQARALAEYRAGISKTSDALGVLRGRVVALDVANGKAFQSTGRVTKQAAVNAQNLEQAATAYSKLTNQTNALRGRIALLGEDSRKALTPMLSQLDVLDKKNAQLFSKGNRFNFRPQLEQMTRVVNNLGQQVTLTEKAEKAQRVKLETLREQGRQLLANNKYEELAARATAVRQGQSILRNADLTGTDVSRRASALQRMASTATYARLAEAQLNTELSKPAASQNAARIDQLINRLRMLRREQGLATAEQIKLNAEQEKLQGKGGFFAGVKSVGSNLFDNPEGSGAAFGAGALVGRVGAYAIAASAIYGTITAIQQAIAFSIEFEDALAQLQAISGSTATEMERLSEGILKVSRTSVNSVLELTKSATVIAQAGYAGAEIEQMLQSVVNLSAASGSSPDESVEILTSALGAFQLGAQESTRVTDILVSTLNKSKLSVNQVQLALQYLGNTAASSNISFEELVATVGSMADAGIRSGSTIATGLRQMLVDFMDPSEKLVSQLERIGLTTADIDVKVLGLNEVLYRLRDAGFEAYGVLETRAAAAYVAASRNIENTERLLMNAAQAGAAEAAAAERSKSLTAEFQQMLNKLAAVGKEIGENFIPLAKILLEVFGSLAFAVAKFVEMLTFPLRLLRLFGDETKYLSVSLEEAEEAFRAAGYSAQESTALAAEMGDSLNDVTTALNDTRAEMATVETTQASLRSETEKLITRQNEMAGANGNLNETTTAVEAAVANLAARFPGLRSEFEKTKGGIAGLIQALMNLDRKAQESLLMLSQTALAQSDMERRSALRELGAVSAQHKRGRVAKNTKYSSVESRFAPGMKPGLKRKDDILYSLIKKNDTSSLQKAHQMLLEDPELRALHPGTYSKLGSAFSRYANARQSTDVNREQYEASKFALSKDGQKLSSAMRYDTANSVRAASQGSAAGMSRAELKGSLQSRLAWIDQIDAANKDNPYAARLIEEARASTHAAINRLSPQSEEGGSAKKKTGGGPSDRRARDNARREKELSRIDGRIQKEEVEFRKELYENLLESFEEAPDLMSLEPIIDDIEKGLNDWLGAEAELAIDEIEAMKPTPEQEGKMRAAAGRKAEQLRIEQVDKLAASLASAIKDYIERTTSSIERTFDESMRFTERNLKIAQGKLDGLNNPVTANNVPNYLRVIAQRNVDIAADRNKMASIEANARRISQQQALSESVRQSKSDIEARLEALRRIQSSASSDNEIVVVGEKLSRASSELRQIDEELYNLDSSTQDLIDSNDALRASYEVLNTVPKSFGAGLVLAAEAMRIEIGAAKNLGQELINNLDQPLRTAHESFKGFFRDILSGTTSIAGAFKKMAESIIDSILEMVAVAIANQFFSLILGAFGVPSVGGAGAGTVVPSFGNAWGGGPVKLGGSGTVVAKRMYGGGSINSGLPTRDSTLIHAAKEEYLIRRPAAQSLGKGFLDAINARGASALKGVGQTNIVAPTAPPVYTNVYVISPEEKPSLGPNDVIAAISSDVLKGGITKKLIKQVASGG